MTLLTLIGMLLAVVTGCYLSTAEASHAALVLHGCEVIGCSFITALKAIAAPLVFLSLVVGTSSLDSARQMGRIGLKTLIWYMATTALAVCLGILAASLLRPGVGVQLPAVSGVSSQQGGQGLNLLHVVVVAAVCGTTLAALKPRTIALLKALTRLNAGAMTLVKGLMWLAPLGGGFGLISTAFASGGLEVLRPLSRYLILATSMLFFYGLVVNGLLLWLFAGRSPWIFARSFAEVWMVAFGTVSSYATLPVSLRVMSKDIGVSPALCSFTLPLGATCNMNGLAICYGVLTVFMSQAYGLSLGPLDYGFIVLATLAASIGTAGLPGVGLLALSMVFQQMGIPVEAIGLLIGVSRFTDIVATAVNITGDAVVTCIVENSELARSSKTVIC